MNAHSSSGPTLLCELAWLLRACAGRQGATAVRAWRLRRLRRQRQSSDELSCVGVCAAPEVAAAAQAGLGSLLGEPRGEVVLSAAAHVAAKPLWQQRAFTQASGASPFTLCSSPFALHPGLKCIAIRPPPRPRMHTPSPRSQRCWHSAAADCLTCIPRDVGAPCRSDKNGPCMTYQRQP